MNEDDIASEMCKEDASVFQHEVDALKLEVENLVREAEKAYRNPDSELVSLRNEVAALKQNVADLQSLSSRSHHSEDISELTAEEIQFFRDHLFLKNLLVTEKYEASEVFGSSRLKRRTSNDEKSHNDNESNREQEDAEDEVYTVLPKDTFSFIAQGKPCSGPFTCALVVFAIQAFTFVVLLDLLSNAGRENHHIGEFFDLPPNVEGDVRACQVVALLITVLSEDNIINSLDTWRIGFDKDALAAAKFDVISFWWWSVSACFRFFGGIMAVSATFVLIMQTDNARDVLLNFTAVQFVSLLDDSAFVLAELGFFGTATKDATEKIQSATASSSDKNPKQRQLFHLPVMVIGILSLWFYFSWTQANGQYLCENIFVQFGDEVADLAHFSGVYKRKEGARWSGKVEYVELPHVQHAGSHSVMNDINSLHKPALFGYCTDEGAWVFSHGSSHQSEPEICDWQTKSSETESFDITSTSSSEWFVKKGSLEVPIDRFYLSCFDCLDNADFCGDHGDCENNRCECHDGWYGLRCEFPSPCDEMIVETKSNGFPLIESPFRGEMEWPDQYAIVEGVSVYDRPVYIGAATAEVLDLENFDDLNSFQSEPVDVIVFHSGRRWELVLGTDISQQGQTEEEDNDKVFAGDFHSFWSKYKASVVSDATDVDTATDAVTPQGLRWNSILGSYVTEVEPVLTCKGLVTDENIRILLRRSRSQSVAVTKLYGNISEWDTSNVRDMSGLFWKNWFQDFNGNISSWDLSSVTDTSGMFFEASEFNQDLSSWTVSSVVDMSYMFYGAESFNQSLALWDTFLVTNMQGVFLKAEAFDQDISGWDTGSVRDMSYMFSGTVSFNQDLTGWNTASVTGMSRMFNDASSFNGDLSGWDTSSVTSMKLMFFGAQAFNRDISSWNTSSVSNMRIMFSRAESFNQDLSGWDTSLVRSMRGMFSFATLFNSDLSGWNVSSVEDMENMFQNASSFNQTLCWNVSAETKTTGMFCGSSGKFNRTCVDDENILRESQSCLTEETPFGRG